MESQEIRTHLIRIEQLLEISVAIQDKTYKALTEMPIDPEYDEEEGDDPNERETPEDEELEEERIATNVEMTNQEI